MARSSRDDNMASVSKEVLAERKLYADVAELADALDLGSSGRPCRFDSCHPHYMGNASIDEILAFLFFFYCKISVLNDAKL